MMIAKVEGIITKKRKYEAVKIHTSFPGWNVKPAERDLSSTTPGITTVAPTATQAIHTTTTEMIRYLNFTELVEFFMIMTTTTAKTAINADLPFPPIAMIAIKSLQEM